MVGSRNARVRNGRSRIGTSTNLVYDLTVFLTPHVRILVDENQHFTAVLSSIHFYKQPQTYGPKLKGLSSEIYGG
jgi:hypothetical protein